MVSKVDETRAKETMKVVMTQVNSIGRMVEEKNFKKAHDLRDKLFSLVIRELCIDIERYTKRDIEELLNVLQSLDDWGL